MDPLPVGARAPDFELKDSKGGRLKLSDLRGKKVILYFFPKAFTGGCTQETREFAGMAPSLAGKGVEIVGISVDDAETQARFAVHCSATFPIVGDPTKEVARSFGVLAFLGVSKRVTFFIDADGIIREVVSGLLPGPHARRARELFLEGV